MRRLTPRHIGAALADLRRDAEPTTVLARVQAAWPNAVGPGIAAEAEPVGERAGVLTVACHSAVWAQELQLRSHEVLARLNEALGGTGSAPLAELRVRTASGSR